jgi:C-terminal processing protease CtpA/Prc
MWMPPFSLAWAEGRLVVLGLAADANGLNPGDIIEMIDGRLTADVVAEAEQFISGATPQWKRSRILEDIMQGSPNSEVALDVASTSGAIRSVMVRRSMSAQQFYSWDSQHVGRPAKVAEIKPGIIYLDIDRVNDDDIAKALADMERASGIIIDFRGYPNSVQNIMALFTHMSDRPLTSPQWHIPIVTKPDRDGMTFEMNQWPEAVPELPRFRAKIAFLTDGGAISYAETPWGSWRTTGLARLSARQPQEPTATSIRSVCPAVMSSIGPG